MFEKFWLRSAACRVIIPHPGMEPMLPALEPWSLNQWTTREVPIHTLSYMALFFKKEGRKYTILREVSG